MELQGPWDLYYDPNDQNTTILQDYELTSPNPVPLTVRAGQTSTAMFHFGRRPGAAIGFTVDPHLLLGAMVVSTANGAADHPRGAVAGFSASFDLMSKRFADSGTSRRTVYSMVHAGSEALTFEDGAPEGFADLMPLPEELWTSDLTLEDVDGGQDAMHVEMTWATGSLYFHGDLDQHLVLDQDGYPLVNLLETVSNGTFYFDDSRTFDRDGIAIQGAFMQGVAALALR